MRIAFSEDAFNSKYLPLGKCLCRIKKVEIKEKNNYQEAHIFLEGVGEWVGHIATDQFPVSGPNAIKFEKKIVSMARACGISDEVMKAGQFDLDDMVGKVVVVDSKPSKYMKDGVEMEGRPTRFYNPMTDADRKSLASFDATESDIPF